MFDFTDAGAHWGQTWIEQSSPHTSAKGNHQKFGLMAQTRTNLRDTCDHISRSSCNGRRRVDEHKPTAKVSIMTDQSIVARTEPQGTGHV